MTRAVNRSHAARAAGVILLLTMGTVGAAASAASAASRSVALSRSARPHVTPVPRTLWDISCTSTTFCAADDTQGNVIVMSDGTWGKATPAFSNPAVLSCTSTKFCMAVNESGIPYTYNGSTWTAGSALESGVTISGLSCTSTKFCLAVDNYSGYYLYDGTSWTGRDDWDPAHDDDPTPVGVSCQSATFCESVNGYGDGGTFNGSSWVVQTGISTGQVNSVSCPVKDGCTAVDSTGRVLTFNGTTWTTPTPVDTIGEYQFAVSCGTTTSCTIVDQAGDTVTEKSGTWQEPATTDTGEHGLNAVDCVPSSTTCLAVDGGGRVLTNEDGTWKAPVEIDDTPYPTKTSLRRTPSSRPTYGNEQTVTLHTTVSTTGEAQVSGTVDVDLGAATICTITLDSYGSGKCPLAASSIPAGSDDLVAKYKGNGYVAASSTSLVVKVNKLPTTTKLTLSHSKVAYDKETTETITAAVTPKYGSSESGQVDVDFGHNTLCVITLGGSDSCTLGKHELPKGTYSLVAKYAGSTNVDASSSSSQTLTITG